MPEVTHKPIIYMTVIIIIIIAESERKKFVGMLEGQEEVVYTISRVTLFSDVLSLYTAGNKVGFRCPFRFSLNDERGVDAGGVTKDVFSSFFEETYVRFFDGTCLLHPAIHASLDTSTFSILGGIISHAYLVAGVFPDKVAFPCLVAVLLGSKFAVPDSILQEHLLTH